ncbi:MAG: hypothetical protein U0263_07240 [Polyangiaceae bacterium]
MEDPVRFCDGADESARQLMRAMREERPPAGALRRASLALGVAAASTAVTATGSATAASSSFFQSLGWLGLKWLSVGALVGAAVSTGATLVAPPRSSPRELEPVAHAPTAVAASARVMTQPEIESPPAESPTSAKPNAARPPAAAATQEVDPTPIAPSVGALPSPVADTLAREVELLDGAREALRRNSPGEALSKLDGYAHEFPRGRMGAEAFVVRLDALVRSGRSAEARALAERHLATNPASPHAAKIRKLTGLGAP